MKLRAWHAFVVVVIAAASITMAYFYAFHKAGLPPVTDGPNSNIEYKTINVYTGNVVSPTDQKESLTENRVKNPGRTYPITDEKTFRILPLRKYVCEEKYWADSHHVESLEVKLDGKWREVYQTEDKGDGHCWESLNIDGSSIVLSPLKDYVRFFLRGWEWGDTLLVDIRTGKNVLEKGANPGTIIWSKDGRSYAFIGNFEPFGGSGRDGVWVSGYKQPDTPSFVFDAVNEMDVPEDKIALQMHEIDGLTFVDNGTIEFSVFNLDEVDSTKHLSEAARYRYDLKNKKLTSIPIK